jgi:hypothetical protein
MKQVDRTHRRQIGWLFCRLVSRWWTQHEGRPTGRRWIQQCMHRVQPDCAGALPLDG